MTPPMHRDSLRNFSGGQNARTILLGKMPRVTDSPPVLFRVFCHDLSPAEIASYMAYPSFHKPEAFFWAELFYNLLNLSERR